MRFDPSVALSFLRGIVGQLRDKRLWPVVVALLVAIVAVPLFLSKSSASTPVAQLPRVGPAAPPAASLPAVSSQTGPVRSRLKGHPRSPFAQQSSGKTPTTASATAVQASTAATGSGSSGTGAATTPTTSNPATSTPTSTTPATTPTPITPTAKPKPAPTALTATQSYRVVLAITNSSGGLNTIDPLERLSALPSDQQPLMVELGVLKGGKRVLFLVQRGTVLSGPGRCTPGPIDCEILSLAVDQTEALSMQSATGVVAVALFAVTAIKADEHPSDAAADKARRTESAAGRALLNTSALSALSLFRYDPSLGTVVDLRNLEVGGG
jgi:hypothetical protein